MWHHVGHVTKRLCYPFRNRYWGHKFYVKLLFTDNLTNLVLNVVRTRTVTFTALFYWSVLKLCSDLLIRGLTAQPNFNLSYKSHLISSFDVFSLLTRVWVCCETLVLNFINYFDPEKGICFVGAAEMFQQNPSAHLWDIVGPQPVCVAQTLG